MCLFLKIHYSNVPSLQHSDWGEDPEVMSRNTLAHLSDNPETGRLITGGWMAVCPVGGAA